MRPSSDGERESLQIGHAAGLEGRQRERAGQGEAFVADERKRQSEPPDQLPLIGGRLGGEPVDLAPTCAEAVVEIAEALGSAASSRGRPGCRPSRADWAGRAARSTDSSRDHAARKRARSSRAAGSSSAARCRACAARAAGAWRHRRRRAQREARAHGRRCSRSQACTLARSCPAETPDRTPWR